MEVVWDEAGCTDTAYATVILRPEACYVYKISFIDAISGSAQVKTGTVMLLWN